MRPATEALWCRLSQQSQHHRPHQQHQQQQQQRHQYLLEAASDCGFFPLRLSQRCLVRPAHVDNIGQLLGSLSVFGCLADGRCPDSGAGSDLVCREVALVRAGATKAGLNALLGAVRQAENVGRPVCLVVELEPPEREAAAGTETAQLARDLEQAMRDAWPKGSRCCYRAAAFLLSCADGDRDGGHSAGLAMSVRRLGMEETSRTMATTEEQEKLETAASFRAVLIAFESFSGKLEARGS